MTELSIPNNRIGFVFNVFWRENDVTVLKANVHFPITAQKVIFLNVLKKIGIKEEKLELKKAQILLKV